MKCLKKTGVVLALLACGFGGIAQAQQKSGEQTYKDVCMVCHAAGVANAPKLGDAKAWAPLIKEGQAVLTAHAWVGVRGMPARGGSPNLSQEDFAKAVAYMANSAGGKWKDPDTKLMAAIQAEEKKRIVELKVKK
ncbi:MAG: c-type cytochrome [Burkholderiales bacterium]|nr:c-type cytochrome [Burkholderiales bacterium]